MFNDILAKEECKKLVSQLAECAFPFQCAHGRPSTIPLVELSADDLNRESSLISGLIGRNVGMGSDVDGNKEGLSFGKAFQSWVAEGHTEGAEEED